MASCKRTLRAAFLLPASCVTAACLALGCIAYGQASYPDQEIHIHDLPGIAARTPHASDVLAASLEIVFNDKEVCCGKDSALEDSVAAVDADMAGNRCRGLHAEAGGDGVGA